MSNSTNPQNNPEPSPSVFPVQQTSILASAIFAERNARLQQQILQQEAADLLLQQQQQYVEPGSSDSIQGQPVQSVEEEKEVIRPADNQITEKFIEEKTVIRLADNQVIEKLIDDDDDCQTVVNYAHHDFVDRENKDIWEERDQMTTQLSIRIHTLSENEDTVLINLREQNNQLDETDQDSLLKLIQQLKASLGQAHVQISQQQLLLQNALNSNNAKDIQIATLQRELYSIKRQQQTEVKQFSKKDNKQSKVVGQPKKQKVIGKPKKTKTIKKTNVSQPHPQQQLQSQIQPLPDYQINPDVGMSSFLSRVRVNFPRPIELQGSASFSQDIQDRIVRAQQSLEQMIPMSQGQIIPRSYERIVPRIQQQIVPMAQQQPQRSVRMIQREDDVISLHDTDSEIDHDVISLHDTDSQMDQ